jgi:membrane protein CcdC involved in cytochrome C biogenesis
MSDETTASPSGGRREQFEEEIAAVRIRTGKAEAEHRFIVLGLVAMIAGVVVCVIAYFASTGEAFTNDILELLILAAFGIALTILGAAVFLRYSLARFLRFWLLRLIYEQQDQNR